MVIKETKQQALERRQASMSDEELVEIADRELSKLCKTGARSFIMTVPPKVEDTDMIFGELIERFKKRINE